uniref:Uncharacterized protein n=1 Tax=Equus asinus TaxID=9793 RepID=A0A9L0J876_EQUAS
MQRLVAWDPACLPLPPPPAFKSMEVANFYYEAAPVAPPAARPGPRPPAGELGSIGDHERAIDFSPYLETLGAPQAPAPATATDTFEAAPPAPAPAPASSGQHHDFLSDLFSDDYGGKNCKKAAEYGYVSLGRLGAAKGALHPGCFAPLHPPPPAAAAAAARRAQGGAGLRARGLQAEGGGRSAGRRRRGHGGGLSVRAARLPRLPGGAEREQREPVHVLVVQPARHAEPRRRQGAPGRLLRGGGARALAGQEQGQEDRGQAQRRVQDPARAQQHRRAQEPRQGQDAQPGDAAQGPGAHGRERAAAEEGGAAVARAQHPAELVQAAARAPARLLRPLLARPPRAAPAAGLRAPGLRPRARPGPGGAGKLWHWALGGAGSSSVILIFYYISIYIFVRTNRSADGAPARGVI